MKLKVDENITEENADRGYSQMNWKQCIQNLEFMKDSYLAQMDGVDKRLLTVKADFIACIITYIVIFLVMTFLISVGTRFPFALSMFAYVGVAYLIFILYKCSRKMITAIISYGVHFEKKGFMKMAAKYELFTLGDEKRHCEAEISKINNMLEELRTQGEGQVDRKYWNYEYIEKYAFTQVNDFYDKNEIFITLIFVIAFFIIMVGVAKLCIARLVAF